MSLFAHWYHGIDIGLVVAAVADILLVAFVIYRVLLLIRGTRAAYMLGGLLAVALLYWGAKQLSLRTFVWLLDYVINYALLIVIIVFQRDIRRALLRIGRRLISPRRSPDEEPIEVVAGVAEVLARRGTGALIVFEREQELDEVVHAGVRLDARLSAELLMNLFTPAGVNPLHDGAAVLRGAVIARAGALLPLSRERMDVQLGTRHRAAVGVTEETDAICIVVSEERNEISLCAAGQVFRGVEGDALRQMLRRFLAAEVDRVGKGSLPWERIAQKLLVGERRERGGERRLRFTGGPA